MLPATGPPRASTRQRAITTANKAKMTPLRPPTSQSVTTSPKENKPASATSLHVHRSKAAGPGGAAGVSPQLACRRSWPVTAAGPDARPIIARSHSAHPGGFAYLAAVPTEAAAPEVQAGWGARRARSLEGWGPQRLRPLPCRLGADRRPPARGGLWRQQPGLSALPQSQRVRFSFTTKSPRHRNPTGG